MLSRYCNLFNIYAKTIKHLEIGHKSDVTTVAMATMTIQDGVYFGFKPVSNAFYFKNHLVTPIFDFRKHFFTVQ